VNSFCQSFNLWFHILYKGFLFYAINQLPTFSRFSYTLLITILFNLRLQFVIPLNNVIDKIHSYTFIIYIFSNMPYSAKKIDCKYLKIIILGILNCNSGPITDT